ncbi:MAG: MarR family transcriptional regulator [Actinobacteria bacterium]|nr:MarR family transcriptional regulator [Actinomycetota bacterium]
MRGGSSPSQRGEAIVDLLQDVASALREELFRRAREAGMPRFSRELLVILKVTKEPGITVNELARRTDIPKSQVSSFVTRLAAEGVLRKEKDPRDQRLIRLFLTEEGHRRAERWHGAYRTMLVRTVRSLSEEEAGNLMNGLVALRAALAPPAGRDRARASGSLDPRVASKQEV